MMDKSHPSKDAVRVQAILIAALALGPLWVTVELIRGAAPDFAWMWLAAQLAGYAFAALVARGHHRIALAWVWLAVNWMLLAWIFHATAGIS